ncbi:MAG: VCBS repeat-containing protein [Phycisphaeraceae bacterium]|nr:MAG: VCBS repeat-containing protein [Phycisphaeraceae bacterium]
MASFKRNGTGIRVAAGLAVVSVASTAFGEGCPGLVFSNLSAYYDFPSGIGVISAQVGELTGDGIPDIVTSDSHNGGVSDYAVVVMHGIGNGVLGSLSYLDVGIQPYMVRVADLDADGDDDIIANGSGGLAYRLSNGDGTFATPVIWWYNAGFGNVLVKDINNDGAMDIIATGDGLSGINVFIGHGDGTFDDPIYTHMDTQTVGLDIGDFDHDGNLDAVLVHFTLDRATVMLGDGTGSFVESQRFAIGHHPVSTKVADFDGDGELDVVIAYNFLDAVDVGYGNGDGTFGAMIRHETNVGGFSYPQSIEVNDLDNDGYLDIITAAGYSGPTILLGRPGRGFLRVRNYGAGGAVGISSIAVADLNLDGVMDVIAGDTVLNVGVHVVINSCEEMCSHCDMAAPYGDQDVSDVTLFASLFLDNNPIADLNRDDLVDLGDIVTFITEFASGCP